jgi:hypothetical protein
MGIVNKKMNAVLSTVQNEWLSAKEEKTDTIRASIDLMSSVDNNGNITSISVLKNNNLETHFIERIKTEASKINLSGAFDNAFTFSNSFSFIYYPIELHQPDMQIVDAKVKPVLTDIHQEWMELLKRLENKEANASFEFKCSVDGEGKVENFEYLNKANLDPDFSLRIISAISKLNFKDAANNPFYFTYSFYFTNNEERVWKPNWKYIIGVTVVSALISVLIGQ